MIRSFYDSEPLRDEKHTPLEKAHSSLGALIAFKLPPLQKTPHKTTLPWFPPRANLLSLGIHTQPSSPCSAFSSPRQWFSTPDSELLGVGFRPRLSLVPSADAPGSVPCPSPRGRNPCPRAGWLAQGAVSGAATPLDLERLLLKEACDCNNILIAWSHYGSQRRCSQSGLGASSWSITPPVLWPWSWTMGVTPASCLWSLCIIWC